MVYRGRLRDMLPACGSVYAGPGGPDPLCNVLYGMFLSEENGVFRYGTRFCEDFRSRGDALPDSPKAPDPRPASVRDPDRHSNGPDRFGKPRASLYPAARRARAVRADPAALVFAGEHRGYFDICDDSRSPVMSLYCKRGRRAS